MIIVYGFPIAFFALIILAIMGVGHGTIMWMYRNYTIVTIIFWAILQLPFLIRAIKNVKNRLTSLNASSMLFLMGMPVYKVSFDFVFYYVRSNSYFLIVGIIILLPISVLIAFGLGGAFWVISKSIFGEGTKGNIICNYVFGVVVAYIASFLLRLIVF